LTIPNNTPSPECHYPEYHIVPENADVTKGLSNKSHNALVIPSFAYDVRYTQLEGCILVSHSFERISDSVLVYSGLGLGPELGLGRGLLQAETIIDLFEKY
jgi:hypothetical protein